MLARLTNTSTGVDRVSGEVSWTVASTRSFGQASFRVYRGGALYDRAYINPAGGFLVELDCGDTLGRWRGVATEPTFDDAGVDITATDVGAWLGARLVARNRTFTWCAAGPIVRQGFSDALGGVASAGLRLGGINDGGPALAEVTFQGQSFADVLGDLGERTRLEWSLTVDGEFGWGPPRGAAPTAVLCQGFDVFNVTKSVNTADRATEVVAIGTDGRTYTASAPEAADQPWLQRQVVIQVETADTMRIGAAAINELSMRRVPPVVYQCQLARAHWGLREGDYVALLLPLIGFGGELVVGRIGSRAYNVEADTVTVEVSQSRDFQVAMPISWGGLSAEGGYSIRRSDDFGRRVGDLARDVAKLRAALSARS